MSIMAYQKIIDEDTKLKAYALFHMAQDRYRESLVFEEQLAKLLGYPDGDKYMGSLSDEIYDAVGSFERGLRKEKFVVEKPKRLA